MLLVQLDELFYIASTCFTPADHFVLIDIQEENLTSLRSYDQRISLGLVAQSRHISHRIQFLNRYIANEIEVSILIALKDSNFPIIGSTEDKLILSCRIGKYIGHI